MISTYFNYKFLYIFQPMRTKKRHSKSTARGGAETAEGNGAGPRGES